jgi:hypothetical protein
VLAVPLYDPATNRLWNLQFIGDAGSKKFLTGGRVKGCCFQIGEPGEVLCVAEGFATGASVHEATGYAVAVAFDCGNLQPVAETMRAQFPNARIVVAADDDYRTAGNPGLRKAREAAAATCGLVAVPDFGADRPADAKDFNDLGVHYGADAVRSCIGKALEEQPQPGPAAVRAEQSKGAGKPSQRDKLISIADRAEYWRCDEGIAHATIPVAGYEEHHRVRSQAFRDWLMIEAGQEYPVEIAGKTRPGTFGKNAIEDALSACEAMAAASRTVLPARLRVNQHDGMLYLDLGGSDWRAVETGPDGWRIVDYAPVPILRTRRTRGLPCPIGGGSLAPLRALLPLDGDDEWRIVILWMLAALRPAGPYPILAWSGEQGTGKSVASRIVRRLIDPCGDDLMQPPREDRDLIAAARNNHVLAFDNLSSVSGELADSLCRLATGGDIGGRSLYTNDDSAAFAAQRPLLLNGIPDLVSRGDLASRTLFVRLAPLRRRRPEAELWKAFDAAAPGILGALLNVLSAALANLPTARLPNDSATFRMADFTLLAIAAEPALGWFAGSALAALRRNMRGAASMLADLDPVAIVLRQLIEDEPSRRFEGLVSRLYARLNEVADPEMKRAPGWPKGPPKLGEYLRRIAPPLRAVGISVSENRTGAGVKVTIEKAQPDDVGNGLSLSDSGEKRGCEDTGPAQPTGVNADPYLPTLPTQAAINGGFPGATPAGGRVGSAGTCRQTGAGAYTDKLLAEQEIGSDRVGSVGTSPPEFISLGARRRIVL